MPGVSDGDWNDGNGVWCVKMIVMMTNDIGPGVSVGDRRQLCLVLVVVDEGDDDNDSH